MKNKFNLLLIILFPFTILSCQDKKEKEFVWIVMQPEVELGTNNDFTIFFEEKPDSIFVNVKEIDGLEFTDNLDKIGITSESSLTDDNDKVIKTFYKYYNFAKPTKLGRIDLPTITAIYKGKEYKSKALQVNVVDKISVKPNDVKIIWSADKTSYKKEDTIKLSFYEYSKFSQNSKSHSPAKNIALSGKDNEISLSVAETLNNIAGIDGFEKYVDQNFEIVDVDWNMSDFRQSMEKVDNELYVKTLILELKLLPKTKGNFTIGPSTFDYYFYKSNSDYFKKFVPNKNGTYTITQDGSIYVKVQSNKLDIQVQ